MKKCPVGSAVSMDDVIVVFFQWIKHDKAPFTALDPNSGSGPSPSALTVLCFAFGDEELTHVPHTHKGRDTHTVYQSHAVSTNLSLSPSNSDNTSERGSNQTFFPISSL